MEFPTRRVIRRVGVGLRKQPEPRGCKDSHCGVNKRLD